jgi:hypothetical protein
MNTHILKIGILALLMTSQSVLANQANTDSNLIVDNITYLEEEEGDNINFDTEVYLPVDFNPYATPSNILHVSYIETEKETELGFNSEAYLPEGFNAHKFFFDIHSVEYLEEEDFLELDFDSSSYLPANFNAGLSK